MSVTPKIRTASGEAPEAPAWGAAFTKAANGPCTMNVSNRALGAMVPRRAGSGNAARRGPFVA